MKGETISDPESIDAIERVMLLTYGFTTGQIDTEISMKDRERHRIIGQVIDQYKAKLISDIIVGPSAPPPEIPQRLKKKGERRKWQ